MQHTQCYSSLDMYDTYTPENTSFNRLFKTNGVLKNFIFKNMFSRLWEISSIEFFLYPSQKNLLALDDTKVLSLYLIYLNII